MKLKIEQDIGRRTIDRTKENKKYRDNEWKQNHHLLIFQAAPLYPSPPIPYLTSKITFSPPLEGGPCATYTSNLNNSGYSYAYGYGYEYVLKLFLALVTRAKKRLELCLPKKNHSTNPQEILSDIFVFSNLLLFRDVILKLI